MENITTIFFWLIWAIQCVTCVVTDKEYALLPPVFEMDNFDRCMMLGDEALFCYTEFDVKPLDPTNTSIHWRKIEELNSSPKNYRHDRLRRGICVPSACPSIKMSHKDTNFKHALAECQAEEFKKYDLYGTTGQMSCYTSKPRHYDFVDIAAIIFFVVYLLFVVYASFYEGLARYQSPEEYKRITTGTTTGRILTCFSIPNNWMRLASMKDDPETNSFKPMQGVRLYNYAIITLTHAIMGGMFLPISNTKWIETTTEKFANVFISSGSFAVQTNFLISSWLLTYQIFKNFNEKSGKEFSLKTVLVILINRYIRLVTPLFVVILFHSTLLYHIGNGPIWDPLVGREKDFCRENGWTNLLFVNNLINPSRMCFVETWYTAIDFHAFLLVLTILYFTVKNSNRLWWIVPSVWFVTKVLQAKKLSDLNIYTFLDPYPENLYLINGIYIPNGDWINTIGEDLTHTGGTLVGILAGYLFYKYRNEQIFTKKIHVVLWWIFTFGMCLTVIILPGMWIFSKHYYPSKWFSLTHFTLSPTLFAIGIAVGIFGFSRNVGWVASWVINWKPTYVLGKLTYCAFLAHYSYIFFIRGQQRDLEYLDDNILFLETVELFMVSLFLGLLICLTVEFPTSAIQSLLLKDKLPAEKKQEPNSEKNVLQENKQKIS